MTWRSNHSGSRPDYRRDQQSGYSGRRPNYSTPPGREDHRRPSDYTNGRLDYPNLIPDYHGSQQSGYTDRRGGKTVAGSPSGSKTTTYNRGGSPYLSKTEMQRQNSHKSQQGNASSNYLDRYSGYPPRQAKPISSYGSQPSFESQQAYSPNYESPAQKGNDSRHGYPTSREKQPMPAYGGHGRYGKSEETHYENQLKQQNSKYPSREKKQIGIYGEKSQWNRFSDKQRPEPRESFQKAGTDPYEAHKAEVERLTKLNEERMRRYEEEKAKYYKMHSK